MDIYLMMRNFPSSKHTIQYPYNSCHCLALLIGYCLSKTQRYPFFRVPLSVQILGCRSEIIDLLRASLHLHLGFAILVQDRLTFLILDNLIDRTTLVEDRSVNVTAFFGCLDFSHLTELGRTSINVAERIPSRMHRILLCVTLGETVDAQPGRNESLTVIGAHLTSDQELHSSTAFLNRLLLNHGIIQSREAIDSTFLRRVAFKSLTLNLKIVQIRYSFTRTILLTEQNRELVFFNLFYIHNIWIFVLCARDWVSSLVRKEKNKGPPYRRANTVRGLGSDRSAWTSAPPQEELPRRRAQSYHWRFWTEPSQGWEPCRWESSCLPER